MSNPQPTNPYAALALLNHTASSAAAHGNSAIPPASQIAKGNIVGLAITVVGSIALEFARRSCFRVFTDLKLELPQLTRAIGNDGLVYGVTVLFLATFTAGLLANSRKRSAAIALLGLIGLSLATIMVMAALLLPILSLYQSLCP